MLSLGYETVVCMVKRSLKAKSKAGQNKCTICRKSPSHGLIKFKDLQTYLPEELRLNTKFWHQKYSKCASGHSDDNR